MVPHDEHSPLQHTGIGEGRLEIVCGPMFSGKTEELLRRVRRAQIARQPTLIFKPETDTRYDKDTVTSHDSNALPSITVKDSAALLAHLQALSRPVLVVAIDEVQFFDEALPRLCTYLANQGIRVIAAGLDLDFTGEPFGCMPELLARAEEVTKLHAVCMETGRPAHFSHRIAGGDSTVEIGEKDLYIPLTRQAFVEARKQSNSDSEEARS
jgi:thymidine kinase|tara:strand:+ start:54 stop:686 length:633 start_codon:yes stop_codon:yes gene_type:complete